MKEYSNSFTAQRSHSLVIIVHEIGRIQLSTLEMIFCVFKHQFF